MHCYEERIPPGALPLGGHGVSEAASFRCGVEGRDEAISLNDEGIASRYALAMTTDIVGDQIHAFSPFARFSI
jgi:hypothetical protein